MPDRLAAIMPEAHYAIRVRGEQRYYAGEFQFTPDIQRALICTEAEARRQEHCLPLPADLVEVVPWWTERWDGQQPADAATA